MRLYGLIMMFFVLAIPAKAAPISICADPDFWPPYSFVADNRLEGEQIGLVDAAMKALGETYDIRIMPWKRCLERAGDGQFDAVFGASYSDDRDGIFLYPTGTVQDAPSPAQLSLIRFVAVVRDGTNVPADLTEMTMPEPVGIPLGYLAAETLVSAGKQVATAAKTADLLAMLSHGRVASVLMPEVVARWHLETEAGNEHLHIAEPAIWETPHYLVFSRKGRVDKARADRVWAAIAAVRADTHKMAVISTEAEAQLVRCSTHAGRCRD